jgi:ABC-type Fe3+ transport system substrate-binding protein
MFAQRFPKLKLDLTVDFSKYHDSCIDRAVQEGAPITDDVVFIQDLHVFPRWAEQNILLRYKPPTFDDIVSSGFSNPQL